MCTFGKVATKKERFAIAMAVGDRLGVSEVECTE
jgi:hypothetical protein